MRRLYEFSPTRLVWASSWCSSSMGENSKSVAPRFEECERKACGERQRLSLDRGKPGCTVPLTLFRPKCGRFRFRAQRQRTPTRSRRTRVGAKSYNRPRISYGVANRLAHSAFSVPFRFFRSKTEPETTSPPKTPKNQFLTQRHRGTKAQRHRGSDRNANFSKDNTN